MFENEDLRLRTIEINAEVEKSHSDLRKLKKENETLKQQVWTLRDEYDKLENIVKEIGENDNTTGENCEEFEDCEDESSELEKGTYGESSHRPDLEGITEKSFDQEESSNSESNKKIFTGQIRSLEYGIDLDSSIERNVSNLDIDHILRDENIARTSNYKPSLELCAQNITSVEIPSYSSNESRLPTSKSILSLTDHFNLDQLLDFASSFHYDRKKHSNVDESDQTIILPNDLRKSSLTDEFLPNRSQNKIVSPSNSRFSTLRRRSSTIIEKMKTSNSSSLLKEVEVSVLGNNGESHLPRVSDETTKVSFSRSSYYFAGSLDGRSQSLGAGLNATENVSSVVSSSGVFHSSNSASNIAGTTSSSLDSSLPLVSVHSPRTSMIRLSGIEPNTIMVSVNDFPHLWDICTQEIIDEIERQISSILLDIKGVRVVSRAAYISVGSIESVQTLMGSGLTIRGYHVNLIDISRESSIVKLSGVPHYIADCTLSILLSAFGIIIGEIERRFYKGVDTGERYVRIKLKHHIKIPKYVTVGGCRIIVSVTAPDIVDNKTLSLLKGSHGTSLPSSHSYSLINRSNDINSPKTTRVDQIYTALEKDSSGSVVSNLDTIKQRETRSSLKGAKKYSSHCLVNLKIPEHPTSPLTPFSSNEETLSSSSPVPSTSGVNSKSSFLSAGNLLRVGSLGRMKSSKSNKVVTEISNAKMGSKSSTSSTRSSLSLQESLLKDGSVLKSNNTVAFKEVPRETRVLISPPPMPHVPSQLPETHSLANGILRNKIKSTEQKSLLPNEQHSATATIKNRLKIGRSVSYDSAKQKQLEKEKRKKSSGVKKMESISENTNYDDDTSDVTPLDASRSGSSRRDSERSTVSSEKSGSMRGQREVIDLPWCGCWGNGCF